MKEPSSVSTLSTTTSTATTGRTRLVGRERGNVTGRDDGTVGPRRRHVPGAEWPIGADWPPPIDFSIADANRKASDCRRLEGRWNVCSTCLVDALIWFDSIVFCFCFVSFQFHSFWVILKDCSFVEQNLDLVFCSNWFPTWDVYWVKKINKNNRKNKG